MHAAVVIAHPRTDSFTHALAERVVRGLTAGGHRVDVIDLYALGFQAAMTKAEREAYHGDEPILDPMVAEHADLVRRVDTLVFVYPTWWSGLPAILKGWLERVLVPGVAFVFEELDHPGTKGESPGTNGEDGTGGERHGKVRPGLRNVQRLVGVSTYGSPRTYVRAVNDNGRRTLLRALRMSCGIRTRGKWFGFYAVDTSTPTERDEFAAKVERWMAALR